MDDRQIFVDEAFCYLTTTGRVTGRLHTIEIWFCLDGDTLYMLSGGGERADWVKNLRQTPRVSVKIRDRIFPGLARSVRNAEEEALARRIVYAKYAPHENDLEDWAATALPIAVDLTV